MRSAFPCAIILTLAAFSHAAPADRTFRCSEAQVIVTTGGIAARFGNAKNNSAPLPPTPAPTPTLKSTFDRADAVFEGYVLERSSQFPDMHTDDVVTFLVERRWKGTMTDTAQVIVRSRGCPAWLRRGHTYVIRAEGTGDVVTLADNGAAYDVMSSRSSSIALLDSIRTILGKPAWVAQPVSQRPYDITPPALKPNGGVSVRIAGLGTIKAVPRTIELLGTGMIAHADESGAFALAHLTQGVIYRARITMPDGRTEDHYLRAPCRGGSDRCSSLVWMEPGQTARLQHLPDSAEVHIGLVEAVIAVAARSGIVRATPRLAVDTAEITATAFAIRAESTVSPYATMLPRIGPKSFAVANGGLMRCIGECTKDDGSIIIPSAVTYSAGSLTVEIDVRWHDSGKYEFEQWTVSLKHRGPGSWVVEKLSKHPG